MAKNSVDAYGAAGKTNLLVFSPDALHLVTDTAHPLYDERVHLPIDEAMVLNIMHQGVIEPVVINKNPDTGVVEVVAGRQRVKCAREANRRLVAKGCEPHQIPAVIRRADPADLAGIMVSENEIRQTDSPLGRARKMRQLQGLGKTDEQLAVLFGCTKQTVHSTLALLDCSKPVREAVEAGKIGVTHARQLAKLEPDQQRERVAEMVKAAEGVTPRARARAQKAIVSPEKPRMRTRGEIEKARDSAAGEPIKTALSWVLGEIDALA